MYKRVVIKLSGEALKGEDGTVFNTTLIESLAKEIKGQLAKNVQIAIVVGGGNFWRGARSDPRLNRVNSDQIGMLATGMNAIYLSDRFESMGVSNKVLSPIALGNMVIPFSKAAACGYLENGQVIIIACGTGHPYLSTDTATALYGLEIDADLLLMLKFGVDCAYTKDPNKYSDAKRIKRISFDEIVSNKDLAMIDKPAAAMLAEHNIPAIILGFKQNNIDKAIAGENIGTFVTPCDYHAR